MQLERTLLSALLFALGCSGAYEGDDYSEADELAHEAGSGDLGEAELAITSQLPNPAGGGNRISGYVTKEDASDEALQCTANMGATANCNLPRSLLTNICFTAAANADSRIRTQVTAVATTLNNLFRLPGVGGFVDFISIKSGTTACSNNGVEIDKFSLPNDGLPITDIRHYGRFRPVGTHQLTEPAAIPGNFHVMISGNVQSRLVVDTALIDAQSTSTTVRDRMIHHTIGHHLIRRFGLGVAGGGNATTHISNTLNNDQVVHNTLHVSQTCLVKNLNLSNLTEYKTTTSANCPAFPNGM